MEQTVPRVLVTFVSDLTVNLNHEFQKKKVIVKQLNEKIPQQIHRRLLNCQSGGKRCALPEIQTIPDVVGATFPPLSC